jgi:peptide-methionine (S)-S-oxide reductase
VQRHHRPCGSGAGSFNPKRISYEEPLRVFWGSHDSTQGMRQGSDLGTQYRSAIYATDDAQLETAEVSRRAYQAALDQAGMDKITTDVIEASPFYYAEDYHQQYLAKNPDGYCPDHSCGVPYKSPVSVTLK